MPHLRHVVSQNGGGPNKIIAVLMKILAFVIIAGVILYLTRGWHKSAPAGPTAKGAAPAPSVAVTPQPPALTIENAPASHIRGKFYLFVKKEWKGPSETKRVISLNPTDFDVVFADAFGDDWAWRWTAGSGHWTCGTETEEISSLTQITRGYWTGLLKDKTYGDLPIPFKVEFEVIP